MEDTNLSRLKKIVVNETPAWIEQSEWREKNKAWLEDSFKVALRVLTLMRQRGISQIELAKMIDVTPQYVSKMLKGKENFSLETLHKLQNALGIKLFNIGDERPAVWIFKDASAYIAVEGKKSNEPLIDSLKSLKITQQLFVEGEDSDVVTDLITASAQ